MAKAKSQKNERQAKIDAIRGQQQSAERRRGLMIVGVCVVVALLIIAFPVYSIFKDRQELSSFNDLELAAIGAPAASCGDIVTEVASGNAEHVPTDEQVTYEESPPAFGPHWNQAGVAPAAFDRKFYAAEDRPELESLVHNLEHGYTILWYDETIAADDAAVTEIRGMAEKFSDSDNLRSKFIAAPWTSDDGEAFPDGKHVAFSHWSVGGDGDPSGEQTGAWQYCSETSGEALEDFMTEYPYTDSPEPDAQ
ncbi:MAG: DUF3105 domain-containing protein [Nocardioides sp.]